MGWFAKVFGNESGDHRIGRQQATGRKAKSSAKQKAIGKRSKDHGRHRGTGKGGAADDMGRWA